MTLGEATLWFLALLVARAGALILLVIIGMIQVYRAKQTHVGPPR